MPASVRKPWPGAVPDEAVSVLAAPVAVVPPVPADTEPDGAPVPRAVDADAGGPCSVQSNAADRPSSGVGATQDTKTAFRRRGRDGGCWPNCVIGAWSNCGAAVVAAGGTAEVGLWLGPPPVGP